MADDAIEQVAEAVEESALSDEDIEELRVLLGKLTDELDVYCDPFSLGGRGYERVIRAPGGVTSVRLYLDWREKQREQLPETAPADFEGTASEAGFGRLSDHDEVFIDCPLCGDEVLDTRVGKHLFSVHWDEIVELAEQRDE